MSFCQLTYRLLQRIGLGATQCRRFHKLGGFSRPVPLTGTIPMPYITEVTVCVQDTLSVPFHISVNLLTS